MTITPITATTPACFGVCCPRHAECARYAAAEGPNAVSPIATCDDNGTNERLPDADITVLCWHAGDEEFWTGYWDGAGWIGCESGGSVLGVTHWAEPKGPQC